MPKILIFKYLQFFFYSGDIYERGHLHIYNTKNFSTPAKIWFENGIKVFDKGSLTKQELNIAIKVVTLNLIYVTEQWELFKQNEKTKSKTLTKL